MLCCLCVRRSCLQPRKRRRRERGELIEKCKLCSQQLIHDTTQLFSNRQIKRYTGKLNKYRQAVPLRPGLRRARLRVRRTLVDSHVPYWTETGPSLPPPSPLHPRLKALSAMRSRRVQSIRFPSTHSTVSSTASFAITCHSVANIWRRARRAHRGDTCSGTTSPMPSHTPHSKVHGALLRARFLHHAKPIVLHSSVGRLVLDHYEHPRVGLAGEAPSLVHLRADRLQQLKHGAFPIMMALLGHKVYPFDPIDRTVAVGIDLFEEKLVGKVRRRVA